MGIHRVHIPTYNWGAAVLWPCLIEEMRINQLTEWGTLFSDKTSTHLTRNLCKRAMCSGTSTHWNLMLRFQDMTIRTELCGVSAEPNRPDHSGFRLQPAYQTIDVRFHMSHTWQKVGKAKSRSKGTSVAQDSSSSVWATALHCPVRMFPGSGSLKNRQVFTSSIGHALQEPCLCSKAAPFRGFSMVLPLINECVWISQNSFNY